MNVSVMVYSDSRTLLLTGEEPAEVSDAKPVPVLGSEETGNLAEVVDEVRTRKTVVFCATVVMSVTVRTRCLVPDGPTKLVVVELPSQGVLLEPAETGLPSVEVIV